MIKVGLAGVGFMSWIHYLAYQKVRGVQLAAICSRDAKKRAGDWRGIQGNFGPPGEQIDVSKMQAYAGIDELLADPNIDVVDNCLPPHLHAEVSIRALQAGKHVFVEKPMALTAAECNKMVAAAKKADKQILVGHVLPYFPEYAHARKLIDSGKYGKVIGGSFKRVISDPLWLEDFYDPQRVGGPLVDLHVHDAHFIRLLFGMPSAVFSQGRMRGEVVEYCNTLFQFADPNLVVNATSGVINQQSRPFTHAYEIHLEKATLHFDFAAFSDAAELMPFKIVTSTGRVIRPDLGDGDPVRGFEGEIKEVVRSIGSGQPSSILSGELARDAIVLCHKQSESVKRGKLVKV
ncbi:MAG: Gfo/Idh/MocA family oxidoreductase [Planctomycetaceae bacterium]|nr:Gfo/Idh/MocA family oxidoreductase [Planctomycetales bacterium]MCB9874077.1 Gfo/Idh/MocA family oxidoreductase [Planctomycetaceae bacterium]MCB9937669.1 Gfo/Idh/MocA family oxidoreductase [Planctomycetaceae bacterium]